MSRRENELQGEFAEQAVADEYDLDHAPGESDWYDCVDPSTGTKYEVKSTHRTLANGAGGRFRLWSDQHRSLAAADGQATAWYVFVLLDSSGNVADMRRMRPATVTKLVHANGGTWNRAGHTERESEQHKIPHTEVF